MPPEVLAWALLFVVTFAIVYRFFAWVGRRFRRNAAEPIAARDTKAAIVEVPAAPLEAEPEPPAERIHAASLPASSVREEAPRLQPGSIAEPAIATQNSSPPANPDPLPPPPSRSVTVPPPADSRVPPPPPAPRDVPKPAPAREYVVAAAAPTDETHFAGVVNGGAAIPPADTPSVAALRKPLASSAVISARIAADAVRTAIAPSVSATYPRR